MRLPNGSLLVPEPGLPIEESWYNDGQVSPTLLALLEDLPSGPKRRYTPAANFDKLIGFSGADVARNAIRLASKASGLTPMARLCQLRILQTIIRIRGEERMLSPNILGELVEYRVFSVSAQLLNKQIDMGIDGTKSLEDPVNTIPSLWFLVVQSAKDTCYAHEIMGDLFNSGAILSLGKWSLNMTSNLDERTL